MRTSSGRIGALLSIGAGIKSATIGRFREISIQLRSLPQKMKLHSRVKDVLDAAAGRNGHIFNLGNGIVPGTPIENVIKVARW
jgi:hypothetical protein